MPKTKKSVTPSKPAPEPKQHKPAQAKVEARLTWLIEPRQEKWATCLVHVWEDESHNYRIYRVDSQSKDRAEFATQKKCGVDSKGNVLWDVFEYDRKLGPGYPRYLRTLEDALQGVENHTGLVSSNREEFLTHAHKSGLDGAAHVKVETVPVVREPGVTRARLGKMNIKDAAAKVMQEEGKPMTPREMIVLMAERGYWSSNAGTPWATLGAALYTDVRDLGDKSRFVQVGKGVFALRGQGN